MSKKVIQILFIVLALATFAFFNESQAIGSNFFITLVPENSVPGKEVTAKVKSYNFDVDYATITWQINGRTVLGGVGEKALTFISPELGKEKRLSVYLVTNDGSDSTKSLLLSGNDIDFLREALTTTPSSYKGKALLVMNSSVKITAIPYIYRGGIRLSNSNLIHEWYVDFTKDVKASGAGKNFFVFSLKRQEDVVVILRVSDVSKTIVFEKSLVLSANNVNPKILFYENSPLEGPRYNKALQGPVNLSSGEIGIIAEPFFFSKSKEDSLTYNWTMNNNNISAEEIPNILSFRAGGVSGKSVVGLKVNNPLKILQSAFSSLEINF